MTATTKSPTITQRAKALAEKTEDAYSADSYASWSAVCAMLLRRGFSEREAEAILRSKWTRWAGDMESRNDGCTAKTLEKLLDLRGARTMFKSDDDFRRQVAELVDETFDAEGEVVRSW